MAKESSIIDEYFALRKARIKTGKEMPTQFREIYYRALMEHASGHSELHREMALELANALKDIIAGTANDLLSPETRSVGKSGRTPTEESCVKDAVAYRRAVESKLIEDRHPIKTILKAFGGDDPMNGGISRSTVIKWMKDPRFNTIEPRPIEPDLIKFLLEKAGEVYKRKFSKKARI
ncbi:MAG: hypothetical protein O3B21_14630 [Proteobacteria bacterium]|nr:hypothetical protein [Pseudomonadota bacterium]